MLFGGICYHCGVQETNRFCASCELDLRPSFQYLPSLPNIALGGYLYGYSGVVQTILRDIKFGGQFRLADVFKAVGFQSEIPPIFLESEAIIPVPSHAVRQFFRGRAHIPYLFDSVLKGSSLWRSSLRRVKYSRSSVGLTRKSRQKASMNNRFRWKSKDIPSSVTIIDDVCTTGATVSEVARCLKAAGVVQIFVITLCYQSL